MRLGLFGGTFNPIHLGHLRAGLEIQERFSLDRVLYLPAAIPPHKATRELLSFAHRLKMVRLAVKGQSRLKASDAEIKRPGKSYSIQTVRYFHRAFPQGVDLFFILGLDAFLEISTWKDYRQLFGLCHFIVLDRQGVFATALTGISFSGNFSGVRSLSPGASFPPSRRIFGSLGTYYPDGHFFHLHPRTAQARENRRLPRPGSGGGIYPKKKALWKPRKNREVTSRPEKRPY